ncbi:hypothetical protein [Roseibium sp.]|uniref:hypothetical protein n=1 Tax=Roseibium sp. TaxID=1936156 RepID=UPI0032997A9E
MGQYEPDDSRDVTNSSQSAPGEPERTGPRESETRRDEPRRGEQSRAQMGEQAGYGNSRDGEGRMEQDGANADEVLGEASEDPARQAEADAKRPLGGA